MMRAIFLVVMVGIAAILALDFNAFFACAFALTCAGAYAALGGIR